MENSNQMFYHIKNLQSTKTLVLYDTFLKSFITLRIYKVLKLRYFQSRLPLVLSH